MSIAKTPSSAEQAAAALAQPTASLMHSPESEKLLISAVLNEANLDIAHNVLAKVASSDFHLEEHGAIWRIIQSLADNARSFDSVAVIDHARASKTFIGGVEYILNLAEDPVARFSSKEAIKAASKRVKELSVLRNLKTILENGMSLCENSGQPYEQVLALMEDDLLNLRKSSESGRAGPKHIQEGLDAFIDQVIRKSEGETIGVGVTTGFAHLDEITSGLQDEDFIILAARPSMGKTAMMLNLARNGAAANNKVLIFSLEMKETALIQRLVGREGYVSLNTLRTGQDINWERVTEGVERLGGYQIYIDDTPGLTINEIRSRARTFVAEHGKCTIFVDYIQHIAKRELLPGQRSSGGDDTKGHVSEVSRAMKGIARELKCPVVGLSQLNRELEKRANKRPIMSDLRESGALEQDADLIMFLYRDEVYNPDTTDPGVAEVIIAKQRDGAVGVVRLQFEKQTGTFSDFTH